MGLRQTEDGGGSRWPLRVSPAGDVTGRGGARRPLWASPAGAGQRRHGGDLGRQRRRWSERVDEEARGIGFGAVAADG
jgi:hypothetical protein